MSLISLIVVIVLVCLALWLINSFVGDALIKKILYAVVVVVLVLWILQSFGMLGSLGAARIN